MDSISYDRILLVGGFCEPLWMLQPLRYALASQGSVEACIWRDQIVNRDLAGSIRKFRNEMIRQQALGRRVAIVTHSFGDWIVRQAIASLPQPPIEAIVSIAPVISASPLGQLLQLLGASCISEVPVMADQARSSLNVDCDPSIRRMVLWAAIDAWVRPYAIDHDTNLTVQHCRATHLSIILQPNIQRLIHRFLTATPEKGLPMAS